MFVGHYGPAGALGGRQVKLWHGFVAVQFLDILWAPFIIFGIESARIVEGFIASNHLDLYHMPYTHSLPMALLWSVVAGVGFQAWRKGGGLIIALMVFSHWVLDFVTHVPDMEIWFGGPKVGLGLWQNRELSLGVEVALLVMGMWVYLRQFESTNIQSRFAPVLLVGALLAGQLYGLASPPPESMTVFAQSAIIAYLFYAFLAFLVDLGRIPKQPTAI